MNTPATILTLIMLAACLTGVSSDIYAPSLLVIADEFNSSIDLAQSSMAIFMVGIWLFGICCWS